MSLSNSEVYLGSRWIRSPFRNGGDLENDGFNAGGYFLIIAYSC